MKLEKVEPLAYQETKDQPDQQDPTELQVPQERTAESDVPDNQEELDFLESEDQSELAETMELMERWDLMEPQESKDWPVLPEKKDGLDEEEKLVQMVPEV